MPTKKFTRLYPTNKVALNDSKCLKRLLTKNIPSDVDGCILFSSPSSFTLNISKNKKYWNGTLEYSTDKTTWDIWDGTTVLYSSENGDLYLRGTGNTTIVGSYMDSLDAVWKLTGSNIYCVGNIENLLDYKTVANGEHPPMANNCYCHLFINNQSLITPPKLPATKLTMGCYRNMFSWCSRLTSPPELPATTLASYCYMSMFQWCDALLTAPELPATTLATSCYENMFQWCFSLRKPPKLPATTLATNCYENMFWDCKSLIALPELPATTLAEDCYALMFSDCKNIKLSETQSDEYQTPYRIPTNGTGITATKWGDRMFYGTGGTFPGSQAYSGTPSINTTYYTSNTVI